MWLFEFLAKKKKKEDLSCCWLLLVGRSGTEEEYTQLHQLLEDIFTYRRDIEEQKNKEKEAKMNKKRDDEKKGNEMRAAALTGMGSEFLKYLNIK